jgi:hypothetical protein
LQGNALFEGLGRIKVHEEWALGEKAAVSMRVEDRQCSFQQRAQAAFSRNVLQQVAGELRGAALPRSVEYVLL